MASSPIQVKKYHLPPTPLIPNSPFPLLHYPGAALNPDPSSSSSSNSSSPFISPTQVYDLFTSNGWQTQWIFRYGATQPAHYHSQAHEVMAVLSGRATLRFGIADAEHSDDDSTSSSSLPSNGIEVEAQAGDVFLLPAGTAHKTFNTRPAGEFALLTPGDAHTVQAEDVRAALDGVKLSGFTMMGAYPVDGGAWDFQVGGELKGVGEYQAVWDVPKPGRDPVLGTAEEGICGQWK